MINIITTIKFYGKICNIIYSYIFWECNGDIIFTGYKGYTTGIGIFIIEGDCQFYFTLAFPFGGSNRETAGKEK